MGSATAILALAALLLSPVVSVIEAAASDGLLQEEADVEAEEARELDASAHLYAGYRFTDADGSREAAEYEYLKDSALFGGDLRLLRQSHRLHVEFDFRNTKDYFGDAWYGYKNIFFARATDSTFFRNLRNIDLDPLGNGSGFDIRDSGERYGFQTGIDQFVIQGKPPDFPLHVYVDGFVVRKSGDRQQRSLLGGAWFNDIVKSSQRRKIDSRATNIKVGINSHLGPVELDFAHAETRFDVDGDAVLHDAYGQSGFGPPPGMRPAGVYPHNLVPEAKSSVDTVKIHTSYDGRLVAAGTFQRRETTNRYSGAEAEYLIGATEITLMPMPQLTFFLKYRHQTTDFDNPNTVTITDQTNPANTFTYPVRSSISSSTNEVSGIARYRPFRALTLKAKYRYRDIDRRDEESWGLPSESEEHTVDFTARARLANSIEARAEYSYRAIDEPAYNIDPDSGHEGRLALSWLPIPKLGLLLSYDIAAESRDDLHFSDTTLPDDRSVRRSSVIGSITYQALERLSLTASAAYMIYKIQQDIEYHDAAGTPNVDRDVPYRNKAQSYSVDVHYAPHERVDLAAGFGLTIGKSSFSPDAPALLAPEPVSTFSKLKTLETSYSAACGFQLGWGVSSRFRYQYADFNDDAHNPYDGVRDGRAHVLFLTLGKEW